LRLVSLTFRPCLCGDPREPQRAIFGISVERYKLAVFRNPPSAVVWSLGRLVAFQISGPEAFRCRSPCDCGDGRDRPAFAACFVPASAAVLHPVSQLFFSIWTPELLLWFRLTFSPL